MSLCFYRNIPQIKAMTFDLDDTLYDNYPVIKNLESNMLAWLHHHYPKTQRVSLNQWVDWKMAVVKANPKLRHDVTQWRMNQLVLGFQFLGYSKQDIDEMVSNTMSQVMDLRHQVEIPKMTHQVLQRLSDAMPLIAITNGNLNPERVGLGGYFDLVLCAGTNGLAKPEPDMFELALNHLQLDAPNILHIGDHLVSDIQGAKNAGFSACWITTYLDKTAPQNGCLLPDVMISQLDELYRFI